MTVVLFVGILIIVNLLDIAGEETSAMVQREMQRLKQKQMGITIQAYARPSSPVY